MKKVIINEENVFKKVTVDFVHYSVINGGNMKLQPVGSHRDLETDTVLKGEVERYRKRIDEAKEQVKHYEDQVFFEESVKKFGLEHTLYTQANAIFQATFEEKYFYEIVAAIVLETYFFIPACEQMKERINYEEQMYHAYKHIPGFQEKTIARIC